MTKPANPPVCLISAQVGLFLTLLAAAIPAEGEALGRLFFTPEERAALDRQRQQGALDGKAAESATPSINGIVRPSGGKTTVWVNGIPQYSNKLRLGTSGGSARGWSGKSPSSGSILIMRKIP